MKVKKEIKNGVRKLNEVCGHLRKIGEAYTQEEFSLKIERNKIGISHALNGDKRYLTAGLFKQICKIYDIFNIDYFLHDVGNLLVNESNIKSATPLIPEDVIHVPFVSRKATASFIESFCDEAEISETIAVTELTEEELKKHRYIVFEIDGDSMYPTLKNGSKILSKIVDASNWEYCNGGVYVVCYSSYLVAKRIKKNCLMEGNTLTLHSDNEMYGETTVRKSDIRGIWEAVRIVNQKIE
jgi:hypothetical protein